MTEEHYTGYNDKHDQPIFTGNRVVTESRQALYVIPDTCLGIALFNAETGTREKLNEYNCRDIEIAPEFIILDIPEWYIDYGSMI